MTSYRPQLPPIGDTLPVQSVGRAELSNTLLNPDPQGRPAGHPLQFVYDVHARSFVPAELIAINHERPALVDYAEPRHYIDYQSYTDTFAGRHFVPTRPNIPKERANPQLPHGVLNLTPETYLDHFLILRNIEWGAREVESDNHSLYKVPVNYVQVNADQVLYSLSIPGLRDDSPHVEMGDTIQLRSLYFDAFGHLNKYQPWDRIQLDANVYSVNRAQEMVYLRIGLPRDSMLCNVVLPLKRRLLSAQWNALAFVDQGLHTIQVNSGTLDMPNGIDGNEMRAAAEGASNGTNGPGASHSISGIVHKQGKTANDWLRRMLFPVESDGIMQRALRTIPFQGMFDSVINYEQLQGVNSASRQDYGVMPYLLSGPPGTGKTKTIVEIAMQLLQTTDIGHILIVAPSEPASDTLVMRLKEYLNPQQLLRLNGPWRADNEVPKEILSYCHMEGGMFYIPPFAQLMKYNVVVTSTRDASILADARVTNSDLYHIEKATQSAFYPEDYQRPKSLHWGALLMDEAAQSTELDALASLSVVCPPSEWPSSGEADQPRFIMAGDQHQLGPRTASGHPLYALSLFARLFDRPVYDKHPLSRSNVRPSMGPPILTSKMLPMLYPPFINLTRNYRSHPAILSVPSNLFYNDTLIPEASAKSTLLQQSPLWQGRRWPVLFVPHYGPDDLEREGGGWYNKSEADLACSLTQQLIHVSKVPQKDIVIMSPFAAQVKLLRSMMRNVRHGTGVGLWDVNIGPLEAFQGLESRVVIICTTRRTGKYVGSDVQRGLGIIGQKKQMNVALTRAKEALIVIGNPSTMGQDQHWRRWMAFCMRNGLVMGSVEGFKAEEEDEKFVGVLEKALVAKEEMKKNTSRKALGAGATTGEEDMWTAGLEAALEEYDKYEEYEEEGGQADEEEYGEILQLDGVSGSENAE